MDKKLISAKEVVKKFNISLQNVNHYTTLGLLEIAAKKVFRLATFYFIKV